MMIKSLLFAVGLAFTAASVHGAECLTEAPPTVYEDENISPQNADYDAVNKMFVAHPGWYNDKSISYYKFRVFAPATYDDLITPESSVADVPIQKVYLVTSTGDFDGVMGSPIIEYHHVDDNSYSDFMALHFVMAPDNYTANDFQSHKDIITSGATMSNADIVVNMPIVPTGSTLQHPETKGKAPIDALKVWYNCVEVSTFVFEVTSADAASYFGFTRSGDNGVATGRAAGEQGFDISVAPNMWSPATMKLNAIPIWHVNQFSRGVTPGAGGGPSPDGMRNVVNLDRGDPGYSPLWQIWWAKTLPINYSADEASNSSVLVPSNGFEFVVAPMWVNCPNFGLVGTVNNPMRKEDSFQTKISLSDESSWIMGSDATLIFNPDMPITFFAADGTELGSTQTNVMGAYEYELKTEDIPAGTEMIKVMFKDALIDTIAVEEGNSSGATSSFGLTAMVGSVIGLLLALW
ncbi:expressed unknown protein [Seminavis robusta]|uniref:Uncharacterized protein n=1 Tax=Seminavis robusta TaxID=568900 RepID=A0A9N8D477_9STRA|nr:expressed unknown protein [Seminavis robusta]|eukprot:Sro1_g000210.1 n/a (463) ;mRNA; r:68160-69658